MFTDLSYFLFRVAGQKPYFLAQFHSLETDHSISIAFWVNIRNFIYLYLHCLPGYSKVAATPLKFISKLTILSLCRVVDLHLGIIS
jgi:hypothetical protein